MINVSVNCDLKDKLEKIRLTQPRVGNYLHLELQFPSNSVTINASEDQMIELMNVLQTHFMARAGFFPPDLPDVRDWKGPNELTPGEVVTIDRGPDDEDYRGI